MFEDLNLKLMQHQFKAFYQQMLSQGIYLAPSAFEAGFISNEIIINN